MRSTYISALEVVSANLKTAIEVASTTDFHSGKINVAIEQLDTVIDSMKGQAGSIVVETQVLVDKKQVGMSHIEM